MDDDGPGMTVMGQSSRTAHFNDTEGFLPASIVAMLDQSSNIPLVQCSNVPSNADM